MIETLKSNEVLWNLFIRKEEYSSSMLDEHQRFSHHLSKYKNILDPEVSRFLIKNGFDFHWLDNKKFALCLTHDIDNIYPSLKYRCFTSLKFASRFKFRTALNRFFKKENPYWNFKEIMKLEEKYGAKSSFYIMADDSSYDALELEDELRDLIDNECEVGLHGGYNSYNDLNSITKEKKELEHILGRKVIGYRNHFLRFKVPDTWIVLSKAGFKYDTTFGYAEYVGFRNGMCHPFKPFNINEEEIDILEIPLVIMDGTLFQYMKLNSDQRWYFCKKIIDTVENLNGVITIVWHNTSFDEIYRRDWNKLYNKILKYCYEKNAWMTSGEEIYKWWMRKKWI